MAQEETSNLDIVKVEKEGIAKQEYNLQQNFIDKSTINLIIESEDQDKKIEDIRKLMELDLDYRERSAKIKNASIAENPVFKVDSQNEKNKRILNYLLWLTSILGIAVIMYSNPIAVFFIGVTVVLSILTVSFNTRVTSSDRRMMSGVLKKLIELKPQNKGNKKQEKKK